MNRSACAKGYVTWVGVIIRDGALSVRGAYGGPFLQNGKGEVIAICTGMPIRVTLIETGLCHLGPGVLIRALDEDRLGGGDDVFQRSLGTDLCHLGSWVQ